MTDLESHSLLNRRKGVVLAIVLYTAKPHRFKFLQACVGIQLWKHGCPHKIFHVLHQLGLCQEVNSARGYIDRLRFHHNSDIVKWKESVQKYGQTEAKRESLNQHPDCRKKLFSRKTEHAIGEGYGVCWDNVQISAHRKHQSSTAESTFHMWGMCLAVQHRVPQKSECNYFGDLRQSHVKAKDLSPYACLPSPEDFNQLKEHMVVLVERALVENMAALSELKKCVVWHIPHKYTDIMCESSRVVNLGVVDANPSSTSGCVEIMNYLHQFVPVKDGKVFPILCSGDGLSFERMVSAHRCRVNGATESDRLEGLIESPQEFHKEILLLQDMMNLLFKGTSEASRGSLAQLKSFFRHKSVKKEVKDNVQHVWDMVQFATNAYIVLCAMTQLKMTAITDIPETFPQSGSLEDKMDWLEATAVKVVEFSWLAPAKEDVRKVAESIKFNGTEQRNIFPYCFCGKDIDDTMVQCSSANCMNTWCHLQCTDLQDVPSEDQDFYCTKKCEEDSSYIYCFCKTKLGGEMVQCHLREDCKKYEWYHVSCVGKPSITDKWYCCGDCALGSENDDDVQNYSKVLIWSGLNLLARKDAVREGNADQIISHWKMDMLNFWTRKHYKYFIIGHHFLAGIAGFLPERLAWDLKWNRLANLFGRSGGNIGMDLLNELLNNDFKEMMKHSRGKYTAAQVDRCAQMGGAFGKKIDQLFSEHGLGAFQEPSKAAAKKPSYSGDVAIFTEEFVQDALFDYCPKRSHKGFEEFHLQCASRIASPEDMGAKIAYLSTELDVWRSISDNHSPQL